MGIASPAELLSINAIYCVAVFAVLVWDWLVCLGQEWQVIWKAKWSRVKVSPASYCELQGWAALPAHHGRTRPPYAGSCPELAEICAFCRIRLMPVTSRST